MIHKTKNATIIKKTFATIQKTTTTIKSSQQLRKGTTIKKRFAKIQNSHKKDSKKEKIHRN